MKLKITVVVVLCFVCTTLVNAADTVLYKSSFADDDRTRWTGWSEKPWNIEYVADGCEGNPALKYTVSDGWNVPILNFSQPIKVSENTVIRFKIKCNSGRYGLNIRDKTEGSEYYLGFAVSESNKWTTIQKYIHKAVYKRFGKEGVVKDGLIGDELEAIHIATSGSEVWVGDYEVVNAAEPVKEIPADESIYDGVYKPINFDSLNKVFPFGFIYQGVAEVINAQIFGQTTQERYDESIRDMKHHYMNVFSNFCDDDNVQYRLGLCSKYDMNLIDTVFCGAQFYHKPDYSYELAILQKAAPSDKLLAWYGPDEPQNYKAWLGNKLIINKYDSKHPVASAFCTSDAIANLGPYCEVTMIDIYSTRKNSTANTMVDHADAIRSAKGFTAGKKVWFISQSYGDRGGQRMPTPAEIRFEVFNSISAGVNGMVFFIYDDSCSYLAPKVVEPNSEKFDETPIDPWFNDNPTYKEMAILGRDVVPVMPSIMNSKETTDIKLKNQYMKNGLVYSSFNSTFGSIYVLVNKSLDSRYKNTIKLPLKHKHLYDLVKLKSVKTDKYSRTSVKLDAGNGVIYLAADPKSWSKIKSQIRIRKLNNEITLLAQDSQSFKEAKQDTEALDNYISNAKKSTAIGKLDAAQRSIDLAYARRLKIETGDSEYAQQNRILSEIQNSFGDIHSTLRTNTDIYAGSDDPEWIRLYGNIREYSKEYFKLRTSWKAGDFTSADKLAQLQKNVAALKADVISMIR